MNCRKMSRSIREIIDIEDDWPANQRQTTMTQIYDLSRSDDADSFVTPPAKRKAAAITITPAKKVHMTAHKKNLELKNLFEIGDLVRSTAGEINHPAYYKGEIDKGYIILGAVKDYRKREYFSGPGATDPEHMIVQWQNIEINGTRYHDAFDTRKIVLIYEDEHDWENVVVQFDCVNKGMLTRVGKFESNDVTKMNEGIQAMVWDNFWHSNRKGWMKILPKSND